jgi:hypothetical protein
MSVDVKTAARRATRRGHDLYARATGNRRTLPTFLIIGGQRCGTTTLFKTLAQHPGVLGANFRKGVHYFDLQYDMPLSWYRSHFPTRRRVTTTSDEHGYPTAVGESSPYYLWHPLAAQRIAKDLPDVRLLVLLRDPVERAYSAHAHERARGFEPEPFERALDLEAARLDGEAERLESDPQARSISHQHHAYVRRGEYIDQLERVEKEVGRERMLVLDSQDFWTAPETLWPLVTAFLSLPDAAVRFERHNARSRSPMPDELRASLTAHYEPFDERLAAWWGRTPSWRR